MMVHKTQIKFLEKGKIIFSAASNAPVTLDDACNSSAFFALVEWAACGVFDYHNQNALPAGTITDEDNG